MQLMAIKDQQSYDMTCLIVKMKFDKEVQTDSRGTDC